MIMNKIYYSLRNYFIFGIYKYFYFYQNINIIK